MLLAKTPLRGLALQPGDMQALLGASAAPSLAIVHHQHFDVSPRPLPLTPTVATTAAPKVTKVRGAADPNVINTAAVCEDGQAELSVKP